MQEHFIDTAKRYHKYMKENNMNQIEFASEIGTTQANISNYVRILKLSDNVLDEIRKTTITLRHVRELMRASKLEEKEIIKLVKFAYQKDLSVSIFKNYVDRVIERNIRRKLRR